MTGRTLSHYQILELLGSGGMGEVYKARDTRLNRFVAIKFLRGDLVTNEARKQRFIQEAQSASALNHPNIVTVHDIFHHEGADCLVMEYVAGKTLDAVIPRQGMRLNEALRIAVQVAEGLRKAHAAGIIHRDIKPSNIIVPEEGTVKILDFGLAKMTEAASASEDDATRTVRPETEEGTVMGTVAYMSPEQAEGRKLDVRTDIFSFGTLLYEMLAGHRAFGGDSKLSTMSAILREEPKPIAPIPPDLEKIVRRCLRKDREKRYQHMDDLKVALEEVREESESGNAAAGPVPRREKYVKYRWITAGAVLATLLVAGGWYLRPTKVGGGPLQLTRVTYSAGLTTTPALSPDGKLLAYASDRGTNGENLDIWLQHLSGGEPVRLTREEGDESEPSFSADGSQLAYASSRGGIYLISVLGGEPRPLTVQGSRPKFSPDGKWIAYHVKTLSAANQGAQLWIIPAAGGAARRLLSDGRTTGFPVWSPDSADLLITGGGRICHWCLLSVPGGELRPVRASRETAAFTSMKEFWEPAAWTHDWVVYTARLPERTQIMRVRLDPAGAQLIGAPEPMTSGTTQDEAPAVSAEGKVAFASLQFHSDLWMLPMDGNQGKVTGTAQRLTEDAALNDSPSISEDGAKVMFESNRDGHRGMWMREIASGKLRKISAGTGDVPLYPVHSGLTRDGRKAAFSIMAPSAVYKYVVVDTSDGSFQEYPEHGWGISPTGRFLFSYGKTTAANPTAIRLETGERAEFMAQKEWPQRSPRLSPDERWLVLHVLNTDNTRQIWLMPFQFGRPAPEPEWIAITDGTSLDRDPVWSPDGNMIYWVADRAGVRGIWAIRLDPVTKRPIAKAFAVQMFPGTRRSMMTFSNTTKVRPAVARDKIVFALGEQTGNIWVTQLPKESQ